MKNIIVVVFMILSLPGISNAADKVRYSYSSDLSSDDYLFGSNGRTNDPVFDNVRIVDLDVDIGITSDCGKISFHNTLKSALTNIFDKKYMEGAFNDIIGGLPMLALCYMSPTMCAILKNAHLKANMIANMRLDQCGMINKYVDSRVEDFYQERAACSRRAINQNNGDFEGAMNSCKNYADFRFGSWSRGDGRTDTNKLLEDSAEWAGIDRSTQGRELFDMIKSMVGDTIVTKGSVSVDYGPRRIPKTPRGYLMALENYNYSKLCEDVVRRARNRPIYEAVKDKDLRELSGGASRFLIDRQTIRSLAFLPFNKRKVACRKLAEALAMPTFSRQMASSLDALTHMTKNVKLPAHRREQLDKDRKAFKDQVDMAIAERKERNQPLNKVLVQINREGQKYQSLAAQESIEKDNATLNNEKVTSIFFDCSDGYLCNP